MSRRPPRVLVVEDEWIVAADVQDALEHAGCEVLGPAATVAEAASLLSADDAIDAAVLDVHLAGEMTFPVAEALIGRGVPFVFVSGFCARDLPERFRACGLLAKPCDPERILDALNLRDVAAPAGPA